MSDTTLAEVRRGRKFDQVVEGALRIFLRDGFEGASVDDIAREAGVSKATLYAYFPDKQVLFSQVCLAECQRQTSKDNDSMDFGAPAPEILTVIGHRIIAFIMSDFGRGMFRLIVSEVSRFPDLAREFYRNGSETMRATLIGYLRRMANDGKLQIEDYDLAAEQFVQLCKATLHDRLILSMADDIRPEQVSRAVDGAVVTFMARYGKAGA